MKKRKYKPGIVVEDINALVRLLQEQGKYIYWNNRRPVHPAVVFSMPFRVVLDALRRRIIREADIDSDYPNVIRGEFKSRRVWIAGKELLPAKSQKVRNHSPDGFNWGYGGSGPAQLALAVMLALTSRARAAELYQDFKWEFVTGWRGDFCVPIKEVEEWIKRQLK